jgi:DNA-binding response OmpR family regulator
LQQGADGFATLDAGTKAVHETVKAMVRRYREYNLRERIRSPVSEYKGLQFDHDARRVWVGTFDAGLTRLEYDILWYVVGRGGRMATYEEICDAVWKGGYEHKSFQPLIRLVHRIRSKLRARGDPTEYIINVRAVGYRTN